MGAGLVTGKTDGSTDTLRNVEAIWGTSFEDVYDARGYNLTSANRAGSEQFLRMRNDFEGGSGNDTIYGNGQTNIRFNGASGGVHVDLRSGVARELNAENPANLGIDTFTGVSGAFGSAWGDMLIGGNTLYDRFEQFRGDGGNDTIDGGTGWDLSRYDVGQNWAVYNNEVLFAVDVNGNQLSSNGITVNLATGVVFGFAGTDTLRGIEAVRGSVNDDVFNAVGFSGSSVNAGSFGSINEFEGHYGNDRIVGNGNTRLSFKEAQAGITVDLNEGLSASSQYLIDGTDPALVGVDTFSGVNAVAGSYYADMFIGTSAKEYFFGADGNDTILGGGGQDVVIYQGKLSEYIITSGFDASGDVVRIIFDTQSGRDGIDQLYDISRLQFSDSGLALDTGLNDTAAEAYRIYKAAFNRTPDAGGLGYWMAQMDTGTKLVDVAAAFIGSEEFSRLNGPSLSDADFVDAMYTNVLGRGADAGGFSFWLGAMSSGVSRATILTEFSESRENIDDVASLIASGIQFTPFESYPTEGLYI